MPSTLRIGIGQVRSLDPARLETPDELLVADQVFDGLVRLDPETSEVLPGAARRWSVSRDRTLIRFTLGDGTFHDGSPIGPEDFVRSWTRLIDPNRAYPFAFLLEKVAGFGAHRLTFGARPFSGVRAVGDRGLEVELREPDADFVALTAHPALSPVPEGVDELGYQARPIGNGPYRLAGDLGVDAPIALEAADDRAAVASVELRPFESPERGWPEFVRGDLDVATIPEGLIEGVQVELGDRGIRPLGRLLYCGFNMAGEPPPPDVRRAFSLGITREALIARVFGATALPADAVVPPSFPGHRPGACEGDCEAGADRARALVEGTPRAQRTLRLDHPRTAVGRAVAAEVRSQLAEVGITIRLRSHEDDDFTELLRAGEHEAFCLVWVANAPRPSAMLEPLLRSGAGDNTTGVADERLDASLERMRTANDEAEAIEAAVDAERRALELMPLVPLAWFRSHVAAKPYVEGLTIDPMGRFDAAALSIEP